MQQRDLHYANNGASVQFLTSFSSHPEPVPDELPYPRGDYKNRPDWDPYAEDILKRRAAGEWGEKPPPQPPKTAKGKVVHPR